jgi:hypothetical protein
MRYPKTLHLTNFYHEASGGISAFYRALFQHANECGREIRLVVPGEQNGCEQIGACGRNLSGRGAARSPGGPPLPLDPTDRRLFAGSEEDSYGGTGGHLGSLTLSVASGKLWAALALLYIS